jgi:hypothetical protein
MLSHKEIIDSLARLTINDASPKKSASSPKDLKDNSKPPTTSDSKQQVDITSKPAELEKPLFSKLPPALQLRIEVIADALTELCKVGNSVKDPVVTRFCGMKTAPMPIKEYLARIVFYNKDHDPDIILIFMLINLDRYLKYNPKDGILHDINIHRFVATSYMVSIKSYIDSYFDNTYFASVTGVSTEEFNALEVGFCMGLKFDLYQPVRDKEAKLVDGEHDEYQDMLNAIIENEKKIAFKYKLEPDNIKEEDVRQNTCKCS